MAANRKKKLDPRLVTALVVFQAILGALTVRDVSTRTPDQVRGPRLLWKLWGGTNTLGSVLYWTVGRRRDAITR